MLETRTVLVENTYALEQLKVFSQSSCSPPFDSEKSWCYFLIIDQLVWLRDQIGVKKN
jgi:hypothetical protein